MRIKIVVLFECIFCVLYLRSSRMHLQKPTNEYKLEKVVAATNSLIESQQTQVENKW